jgi:hypothetical protein
VLYQQVILREDTETESQAPAEDSAAS